MDKRKDNVIVNTTLDFSEEIIYFTDTLTAEKRYVLSNQLCKAGTSIGANAWEAQNAESKADFIHKMKIAAKEADETEYWLTLCSKINLNVKTEELLTKLDSIQKILNKIISTSKNK